MEDEKILFSEEEMLAKEKAKHPEDAVPDPEEEEILDPEELGDILKGQ